MNRRLYLFVFALMVSHTVFALDREVKRELPPEWEGLVLGGRFMDRFLPVPIRTKLTSDTWGIDAVKPRDLSNGIEDPDWSYWGGNILKDDKDTYHMYVCRWLESAEKGHYEWPRSEVVHAVSDHRLGPYKAKEVIGKGHNPEAIRLKDGTYAVYVIGAYYHSKNMNGPWVKKKFEFQPRGRRIVEGLSNLTFVQREDGSQLMVCRGGGIWISETGLSPYQQISNKRVYPSVAGDFEDPVVWRTRLQYHMIVNDWRGKIAYYLRSKDGLDWKVDTGEAYIPGLNKYENGTKTAWHKYERIKILQDQYGRAIQANFAVIDHFKWEDKSNDNHNSKNISIPLMPGRLMTILNTSTIHSTGADIRVKIVAEDGFNPHTDIKLSSLRFGASEEVNYGRGSNVVKTEKSGKDLIINFAARGHGLTENNFVAKMLGKTQKGDLLFAYARLPELNYSQALLSALPPKIQIHKNSCDVELEVQNFGLTASPTMDLTIEISAEGTTNRYSKKIGELVSYEKVTLKFSSELNFVEGREYHIRVSCDAQKTPLLDLSKTVLPYVTILKGATLEAVSAHVPNKGQGLEKLVDGKKQSKLCVKHKNTPFVFDVILQQSAVAKGYTFTSAVDVPARDPKSWSIFGSNDRESWKSLSEVTNENKVRKRQESTHYTLENTTSYRYYRFLLEETKGDSCFQLGQVEMNK